MNIVTNHKAIQHRMLDLDINKKQLADKLGITYQYLQRILNNTVQNMEWAKAIAAELDGDVLDFFDIYIDDKKVKL